MKNLAQKHRRNGKMLYLCSVFPQKRNLMVDLAQLVRVPDCGSVGRGFESHIPPSKMKRLLRVSFFCFSTFYVSSHWLEALSNQSL